MKFNLKAEYTDKFAPIGSKLRTRKCVIVDFIINPQDRVPTIFAVAVDNIGNIIFSKASDFKITENLLDEWGMLLCVIWMT